MGRNQREKHFLELNDEYLLMYLDFLKQENIWNGMGQYWLAKESRKRALSLLNSDIDEAKKPIRSEIHYFHKDKNY